MPSEKDGPGAPLTAPGADVEFTQQGSDTTGADDAPAITDAAAAASPLDAAISHLLAGRSPIPVPHGTKAPTLRNWQKRRITEHDAARYFNGAEQNIGILLGEPSNGLVDVDLDCPEALSLADHFLPQTGSIFGRASKRRSHWLYTASGAKSERFTDPVNGGMLVELRSTGGQTIFPPSTHPSGESITWDVDGAPAVTDAAELSAVCGRLAAAYLIHRHIGGAALDLPTEQWPELLDAVDARLGKAAVRWLGHTVTPQQKLGVTAKTRQNQSCDTHNTCHTTATASPTDDDPAEASPQQRAYALAALDREADDVAAALPGDQSNRLNAAARKLGEFVTTRARSAEEISGALTEAASRMQSDPGRGPWSEEQIAATIASGLQAGMKHPPRDILQIGEAVADGTAGTGEGEPRPPMPAAGGTKTADGADAGEAAAVGGAPQAPTASQPLCPLKMANATGNLGRQARPGYVSFSHYRMIAAGLFFAENRGDPQSKWKRLSGPFEVLGQTRSAEGSDWGLLLRWRDADGNEHEWAMPNEALGGSQEEIFRHLLRDGLDISPSRISRSQLAAYLGGVKVKARARCVPRIGWHVTDNGPVFVLPGATFPVKTGPERLLLQTEHCIDTAFKAAGTAHIWQTKIGKHCVGNSRLVLAVSAAFAAPLLELVNVQSFGVHVVGSSQTGKTTALLVGGSVWGGGGKHGFLDTWRATANGLEGIAEAHCDTLLVLDEMGQVDAREAGEIAYMLANGQGKKRARRDGSPRPSAQWRLACLSSGELTLGDKMGEAGKKPRAGQMVRLIDVPADAGAGMGLFERLHGAASPAAFANALRQAALTTYGAPIREFLKLVTKYLLADRDGEIADIKDTQERFIALHCPDGASSQVHSVCASFGLIAAAGELATWHKLTGWPKGEAEKAAATCFRAWRAQRGGDGDYEIEAGIRQVREFLEKHGASRFQTIGERNSEGDEQIYNRAGYRRRTDAGGWQYLAMPDQFKAEIAKGHNARQLAQEMVRRGRLIPSTDGKSARSERIGDKTMRLYVFAPDILDAGEDDA